MLVKFLENKIPDITGRYVKDILSYSDHELEYVHDYVQWIFPLNEGSSCNSVAPILSDDDIIGIRNSEIALGNFKLGLIRLIHLYRTYSYWATDGNHNLLRITRMLKSTTLLIGPEYSERLYWYVLGLCGKYNYRPTEETLTYWWNAVNKDLDVKLYSESYISGSVL